MLRGRKLLQSTRRHSLHPNDASVEMSAGAVLALIDAFCGTPQSKILNSILDQPSHSLLCGQRFMASLSPFSLHLRMLWLKLPTLAILMILSSETFAERLTIALDSSYFLP